MLLVKEGTQDVLSELAFEEFGACDACGKSYTTRKVGQNEVGEWAELQFEHLDYAKVTPAHIDKMIERCGVCGSCGEPFKLDRWIAERIARQSPKIAFGAPFAMVCGPCGDRCAAGGDCPICDGNSPENH
jgi:RNA polymerase-binding transcription factor DksA